MPKVESVKDMDRSIARAIGYYYFKKNKDGRMEERMSTARSEIESLCISMIHFDGTDIVIRLGRPGLLIGRKGENIYALEAELRKEYNFKTLKIEEELTLNYLYAFDAF